MELLPVTKFPALDTIDSYAVEKPTSEGLAQSPCVELSCSADPSHIAPELVQGYARFVSHFTGLEDVAFAITRCAAWGARSELSSGVVSASVHQAGCTIRESSHPSYSRDEIQFSLDLGLGLSPENGEQQYPGVDDKVFTLHVNPATKDILEARFSYPQHLVPDAAVRQLLTTLATYLAASSPSLSFEATPPELSIINHPPHMIPPVRNFDGAESTPSKSLLHHAFEGWARRKPNAIALDFVHSLPSATEPAEHSVLTYATLNAAASNLAALIRSQLFETGRIVPVYMSTSPELYISYLAILKAGCAFSPIPQDAPDQRVREILGDIACPFVLGVGPEPATGPWQGEGEAPGHSWVDVAEVSRWKEMRGDAFLPSETDGLFESLDIQEDQTAYLLFTSGSTGKPKGVQVPHLAATCSIESHATAIPLPGDSVGDFRWFQFASPTFDPSLMEIFVTLSSGATLCSAYRHLTLTDLEATINEAAATVMMATPSLAALLRPSRLTTLQSLWTMGEKLNRTVIENFSPKPGSTQEPSKMLVNAYGPTEGAINCTFLAPFDYATRGSIIGKALPTCAMLVLDPNSHLPKAVPSGLAGELAIAGPQVSKGYLNRPKETAKSFVHSPEFGPVYRTGDMARIVWDETGAQVIEFLGRITSDQVKVSGRRLELGEIESVLATVAGVSEVVALVSKRDNNVQGSEQIIACLVANDGTVRSEIVRNAHETTHHHLSSYMCPSVYTFFDVLPRSSSGKVDRKAITARIQQGETSGIELFPAPKSVMTNGVQEEWETGDENQALVIRLIAETTEEDVSAIAPSSDLYSLGLDSLGAMRFLQKLRDHGIEGLSVGDVLQSGTPKALISMLTERVQANGESGSQVADRVAALNESLRKKLAAFNERNHIACAEGLGVASENIERVLPTTATQSGMLTSFLRSSAENLFTTRSYIYHSVIPLESGVDVARLQKAWETVTASYDSFRTVFSWLDDDMAPFAQCILSPETVPKPTWNIYTGKDISEEEAIRNACRSAEETIQLTSPPWSLSLITSSERTVIILSMFHGIFDGGSLQLLLEDVSSVYEGKPIAQRTSLEHIVQHHFGADHEATSAFWNKHLEGHSPVAFPSVTPYRPRSMKESHRVEITAPITQDSLKKLSKSIGSTPLAVLQAAWGSILLSYTGTPEQDVVMGSVVSGRLDAESETCIGPTFTTVPVRLAIDQVAKDPAGSWTNRSIARHLTSFNAKTLSYLQPALGAIATADGRLPYDTLLAYQDFGAGSSASGLWSSIDHPSMANDFAVMIEVWPEVDSTLTFRASFNDTHLDRDSAELMLKEMADIVAFILESPDENFQDASSHTGTELKSSFNSEPIVAPEVAKGALLHTSFEEHAESDPDDVALIFRRNLNDENDPQNVSWTYSQLNAIAHDLAEHLLQLGGDLVNSPIPICIEKSPELYVAILGILKAGAAWCPIDTFSPSQRRHDLIARTEASLLLVSSGDGAQPDDSVPAGVKVIDVSQFTANVPAPEDSVRHNSTKTRTSPDNMAYLIWTSGTTGAPKGVPINHSAGVSSIKSLHKDIPTDVEGGVRCMQFSQYTFDVSIQDIFYAWGIGGVLISAPRDVMIGSFSKLANVTKATHAHLTPAFSSNVARKGCETLKVITMIGEKLTQSVADDWGTDMRAFNTYGPAEVTIVSTIREFGNEHKCVKSANIGWPMDSVSVFVTRNQRMVMKGAVGELALAGPQLSPGYLKQEDVNKAKYVWSEEASQTLYYTGDLVRMLGDGSLEYITRVDDLVKLGGIRVELSEITYSLGGCHDLVENIETAILSRPDRPVQVVVAFLAAPAAGNGNEDDNLYVTNDTALEIANAARDKALSSLPGHMLPSAYIVVRNIPRTQSAKTDRRALQAAYASIDIAEWDSRLNPENGAASQGSEDENEVATFAQIADIIATLTNVSPSIVSRTSRLRILGVDSIRAIRLTAKLKDAGYPVSVVTVLNCITVQDLVKLVSSSSVADELTADTFNVAEFNNEWYPAASEKVKEEFTTVRATTIQESLISETMGTFDMYWSNHFFSLDESVDVTRLKQAWLAVCQKTEALRTGFIPVAELDTGKSQESLDFAMLQLIYKLPSLDWQEYDCTEDTWAEVRDERIKEVMTHHQGNYLRSPPWAVTVFHKGAERVMVFTVHHSIHDGPSLSLIFDDVQSAYSYKPPTRHQLSDALSIVLPSETRASKTHSFWDSELKKFSGLDVPVWPDLTGKRVQPDEVQELKYIAEEMPLKESVSRLQAAAVDLGVSSIASIVRAAWAYVSLSYLGLPATVFAETLSDRVLHGDLEDSVGPLISVIPVPFHPEGSARDVLAEQHRLSTESWKYRHIHARDVRKMLQRPRGEPLYPAVYNFHVSGEEAQTSQSKMWRELEDVVGLHVEHPMAMNVFQHADDSLVIEASTDNRLMSREQLAIFVRQIDGLVSAMLEHPDKHMTELINYMPKDLRSQSGRPVSDEVRNSYYLSPTHWLEHYAKEQPDWTAVEVATKISPEGIEKGTVTFGELNARANRVAAFIASFGHKNRTIAICAGRNLPSYNVIIGIFKSGNTYLPIDENLPADRKAFLVEDGDCPIVFTEKPFLESFSTIPESSRLILIDDGEFDKKMETMPSETRDYQSDPDDGSYLLFTSGSTGKPKGVLIGRGNLSSFIESFSEFCCKIAPKTLELGGIGRHLAQANRAFDPHLVEMLFPWRRGMATATAPRPMLLDDLQTTLSKWDITHASFVPSLVDQANILPENCPKLKYMSVGGEKISKKVLDTWAVNPYTSLANAYGPTECTIGCTFAHVRRDTNLRNIGPPLTACVCHVLIPETLDYALRGQTGELCFTGDLVGKGYLNRPDAKGFTAGPNGEKMYRTGDIGRLMPDESVEYLGRGDDQTKIRGQRLELGEVSEVLRASSPIGVDVVTSVAKHPGLSRVQLISFVARSGARQSSQGEGVAFLQSDFATLGKELQDMCKKKLPGYMVPELILPISYIPLAALSGKANVKELHALFENLPLPTILAGNGSAYQSDNVMSRPLSGDEQAVVDEICKVVSIDSSNVGPMTNIFEIGVDSLSAIGLSIKMRKIGYEATVALVMSNPIVEQLARLPRNGSSKSQAVVSKVRENMKDMESEYRSNPPAGVELSTIAAIRPCLPLQEGLIARSINNEGDNLYINHIALQLNDNVSTDQLKSAWQTVSNDNEIMRTTFAPLEKQMAQVVLSADSHENRWSEKKYSSLDDALATMKSQQGNISRDIISGISCAPPVRFHLAKSSENKPVALFISIHHALYDGESFSMLLEDVAARYAGESVPERGSPSEFIEHVYTMDQDKAKQHWVQQLSDCRPTNFREDFNIMEHPTAGTKMLGNKLSELERRSASLQTTVPNLIQAIFGLLLADTVGVSDVTFGLVLSGRAVSVPGAESVLLPCITTVPGRLNTADLGTVDEVIGAVQKSTVKSLEFQHTSLRHIQRWVKSETPLFDCLFSYIRTTAPSKHNLWKELDSHMPAEYPLALEVEANHDKDNISLNCFFSSAFGNLYNGEEFLEKMDAVLSSVVSGETLSLENFNLSQTQASGSRAATVKWDESVWSTTETKIRELTADFCGLSLTDVAKGASFLSLGVDSVTAIQFSRKLREAGLKASSSDIMRFSCVGALAKHIEEESAQPQTNGVKESRATTIPVDVYGKHARLLGDSDSISAMFETTPLQSGMITQSIGSDGHVYVHPHPVRLTPSADAGKLKASLRQVIEANDILRTSFHLINELGSSWIGAVHSNPPFEWKEISLPSGVDVVSKVSTLFSFSEESSFEAPPIRSVLAIQPEGLTLVVIMHHSLYDGASLPFFFEDLATIYGGVSTVERPPFSETVKDVLNGQEESCEFWTRKLRGYEVVEIPKLPVSEASDRMLLSEYRVGLDMPSIIQACKSMEVTVQSVALLAYSKVLSRLLGKRDVVFGQVLAGRSLPTPGADRTLGPLFNTVAHRITFEPKFLNNRAMAQRLQELTNDAQIYQHAPLRMVQNALRQTGDLTSTSLFDTLFVFQKSADFAGSILEEQQIWEPYESEDYAAQTEHKLNVEVDHAKDGIVVRSACNGLYISQEALDEFLGEFGTVFRDIVEHPTRCATVVPERLGDLPLRLSVGETSKKEVENSEAPPHEAVVKEVLADIAGLDTQNISPNTSIFSIGLDSLSAIRIASVCRSKGLKTGVADIMQGNTLRGISQRVRPITEQKTQPKTPLIKDYQRVENIVLEKLNIKQELVETILPCLGGQFYHLVSWLKSGRKLFEPAWPYFSNERLDASQMEESWYKLRQRHPALRTCFAATSATEAVQIVMKNAARDNETFKLIQSDTTITEAAKAQAKEEAGRPSSLFVPPVRLRLIKAVDRDGILVFVNHAAYDAWTMPMYVSELAKFYRGQEVDTNPAFPDFVDHSVRALRELDEKAYWSSVVEAGKPTVIESAEEAEEEDSSIYSLFYNIWEKAKSLFTWTTDEDKEQKQLFVGAWEKVKNVSQMESQCRAAGVSLQTVVLLAVARCLARKTNVQSPLMGLYQTGRSASFTDIEKLTGPCLNVNPLVVPNAVSDGANQNLLEKVQAVQSSLAERVSFEQSSIMDVLRWTNSTPNGETSKPLFNTWINLLWMQNAMPSAGDSRPDSAVSMGSNNNNLNAELFTPLRIGVPTDFIPSQTPAGLDETAVSSLDTSLLPDENVFIDIGPDPKTDSIGFGVRVEGGVMSEKQVQAFVGDIGKEIVGVVASFTEGNVVEEVD